MLLLNTNNKVDRWTTIVSVFAIKKKYFGKQQRKSNLLLFTYKQLEFLLQKRSNIVDKG